MLLNPEYGSTIGLAILILLAVDFYYAFVKNSALKRSLALLQSDINRLEIDKTDLVKKIKDKDEALAKQRTNNDVIAVLNDIRNGGALLHVERVDRNDVFFHQGSQYR